MPQTDDVFSPLTVRENLEVGGYLLKSRQVAPRIEHVMQGFPGLRQLIGRRASKLSGGERKMLAMGRALMLAPALVVLDEPTANLARSSPAPSCSSTSGNSPPPASVLVVEQRARSVLEISDRTYVLGGGRLQMEGTPAELSASTDFVESVLGGEAGVGGPSVGRPHA